MELHESDRGRTSVKKVLLIFLLALFAIGVIFYLVTRKKTLTEKMQGPSCDISLWAHVYRGKFRRPEDRLHIINPCMTVSGIIMSARREKDGDWHVQFALDPEFSSLLNQANSEKQHGYLVLEPICSNPVSQRDTLEEGVCEGFTQNIFATTFIGQRVAVTGAYVIDMEHGWAEIHPVTSIASIQ
jgi:hypothetical protein